MGRDKLSLKLDGAPLVERVRRTLEGFCSEVLVAGEGGADLPRTRRIPDARPGRQGPLAGIEAGLDAAANEVVFVAAGDMPFLSRDLALFLCERVRKEDLLVAVPVGGGKVHPLCAAYSRETLGYVSAALDEGRRSVAGFLSSLEGVEYVERGLERFGDPEVFLMNVNTPEDLERARRLA